MRHEAKCLLGRHDFRSFQAHDRIERKSVTTIRKLLIKKTRSAAFPFLKGMDLVIVEIEASGFLRHMVRNLIGTLIEAGRGRIKKGGVAKILKAKDRRSAGPCAQPQGLYLLDVRYD